MSNAWGHNLRLSIFGESHGAAIGITIDGLPPGFQIDWDEVSREMARRAPGQNPLSTSRRESDQWELLSGFFDGKTTGSPLTAIIRNENTISRDYTPELLRPGHADLPAFYKYGGFADYRGGGHFSGRLTAPLVFAGAIAKQILEQNGIIIGARIFRISDIYDADVSVTQLPELSRKAFPVFDDAAGDRMQDAILSAKNQGNSVGGVIECAAIGVPAGFGEPFFNSLESSISSMMFSIPAIKGIEFGDGFALTEMTGFNANDQLFWDNGRVQSYTNHNGGINGGISNGMPVVFRAAVKPTPTVSLEQTTVDISKKETVQVSFGGRHDPCIVLRAVPVVEAGLALCLLDAALEHVTLDR